MTGYLFVDTETNGLHDYKLPADHPSQPRMAQLGMVLTDNDLTIESTFSGYVKPDGWEMTEEAGRVNGLTTEFLAANGAPVGEVLDRYVSHVLEGRIAVAFHAQYDLKVLRGELRRAGRDDLFEQTPNICVMRALKVILPGRHKLVEALAHFGIQHEKAHDALADTMGAYHLARILREHGELPEAKVYYAKDRPA